MALLTNPGGLTANAVITPQRPKSGSCVCTTANTNLATPTQAVLLWDPLSYNGVAQAATVNKGSRVTKVTALTVAAIVTNKVQLQLYTSKDGGTTKRFHYTAEYPVTPITVTDKLIPVDFLFNDTTNPITLEAGESLYAAIASTQTGIVFRAEGGEYL